ncbi:MAG: sodium:proton antiporter [Actinomycetota bacterium]
MNFLISLALAIIFGSGAFLILQRGLVRVVVGIALVSNASILFIIAVGLSRGQPPIYPLPEEASVSDPLVQAMALTALVISFGVTALLLAYVYRLYLAHGSVDLQDVSRAERREAEALERGEPLRERGDERQEP